MESSTSCILDHYTIQIQVSGQIKNLSLLLSILVGSHSMSEREKGGKKKSIGGRRTNSLHLLSMKLQVAAKKL